MTTAATIPLDAVTADQPTAARATWAAFRRNPLGLASLGILAVLVLVAICAPLIADYPAGYGGSVLK
jgi:peptide/nickel transport system permease protein